MSMFSFPRR